MAAFPPMAECGVATACQALQSHVRTRWPFPDTRIGLGCQGQLESSRWSRRGNEYERRELEVCKDESQNLAPGCFWQEKQMFLFSVLFCSVWPGQISKGGRL